MIVGLSMSAAVAVAVAVAPLAGPPARGLRVERMRGLVPGRPALLRVALEDGGTRHWRAPALVTLAAVDARGVRHAQRALRVGRGPWVLATLPALTPPISLEARADGFDARAVLAPDPIAPATVTLDSASEGPGLAVDGLILSPEIPGELVLFAGPAFAGQRAALSADDPTLAIAPASATLDACGAAVFRATSAGLAAPVLVTVGAAPRRLRLPLAPGAVTAAVSSREITVSHALGGVTAYVIEGDRVGPLRWDAVALEPASDRASTASRPLSPGSEWALASASADFDRVSGAWRIPPPSASPCPHTPLGARWARVHTPTSALPAVVVVFDGAQRALDARAAVRARTRRVALWCAAGSLTLLAALVLRSARAGRAALDREGLSQGSGAQRVVALGVLAIAVMAVALALVVQLRP
jgi:hypothetical protein